MSHPGMKSFKLVTFSEGSVEMKKWERKSCQGCLEQGSGVESINTNGSIGCKGASQLLPCPGPAALVGELNPAAK